MIYFDNAATSYPKPPAVRRAVDTCMREAGGNPGRGTHALALAAAEVVYDCRVEAAALLGVSDPARVCFTLNTTYALNLAIKGLLRPGDHVLIDDLAHNAVYRPIRALAACDAIRYDVYPTFACDDAPDPQAILTGIAERLRPETRMLVATHASNLCGAALPLAELGAFCRSHGLLLVVDAAQSAGHLPIDCDGWGITALCVPGHKGLYGPQGSGMLAFGEGVTMATLIEGGSGLHSLDPAMPELPPERYEPGTVATPAIAGLCAGIRFVRARGVDAIHTAECALFRRLRDGLRAIDGVTVYAPAREGSVLLWNIEGQSPATVAARLDREGFCLRAGLHCAPLAHATLGTGEEGALRVGFSAFSREGEVDALVRAVRRLG